MKLLKTVFLLTAVLFAACQSKPSKEKSTSSQPENQIAKDQFFTINFAEIIKDKEEVPLSEIAESVEFIPLENTAESMIGNVMNVKLTKDYIVVKHNGTRLITQFGSGV